MDLYKIYTTTQTCRNFLVNHLFQRTAWLYLKIFNLKIFSLVSINNATILCLAHKGY